MVTFWSRGLGENYIKIPITTYTPGKKSASESGSGSVFDSKSTVSSVSTQSGSKKDEGDKGKSTAVVADTTVSKKEEGGNKSKSSPLWPLVL